MFNKIEIYDNHNNCVEVITGGLDKKCRTCVKNDGVINVLTAKHKEVALNEMFGMFSLAAVTVSDGLPQKICKRCAKTLVEFYSFKLQTEQVQLMLQIAAGQFSLQNLPKTYNTSNKENIKHSYHNESSDYNVVDDIVEIDARDNILTEVNINSNKNESNKENKLSPQVYTCSDCQVPFKEYAEYLSHRIKVIEKQNRERNMKNDENVDSKIDMSPTELTFKIEEDNEDIHLEHAYSKLPQTEKPNLKSKCVVCNLEFDTVADYLKHKKDKARIHAIPCTLCDKNILPNKIEQHKQLHAKTKCKMSIMSVDSETGEIICSVCNGKFDSRLRYLLHKRNKRKQEKLSMKKRRPIKKHPCPICGVQYNSSILKDHINTHTQEHPYMCEICGEKFKYKSNFRSHQHIECLCDLCGAIFNLTKSLKKHMKMKHSQASFSCDTCHKTFSKRSQLVVHTRSHTGERPYLCTFCGKTFTQIAHLRTHMKQVHSGDKPFFCSKCKRGVDSEEHSCAGMFDLYNKCNICYGFVLDLDTHMSLHRDGHEYICGFCNQIFTEKSELISHKTRRVCRRDRYKCNVCLKHFQLRASLRAHTRLHTGEKPYTCNTCGKRFANISNLHSHMKLHTGEKRYECPYCSKKFAVNGTLKQHIRMHTGEKPYVCDYCFKTFSHSSSMRKHRLIHLKYKTT